MTTNEPSSSTHRQKEDRGEAYVIIQFLLLTLLLFGPRSLSGRTWAAPTIAWTLAGLLLMVLGLAFAAAAVGLIGRYITPLPYPKEGSRLVTQGVFRWVRHPMYFGVINLALGWALYVQGELTLVYALVLIVFFDIKSRREETWLIQHFPDYAAYRQRVRKLIPFIY